MALNRSAAKSSLRKHIKLRLNAMTPTNRQMQSERITQKLLASSSFRLAQRICIYLSMPTEVDTMPLIRASFENNKHVFVPYFSTDASDRSQQPPSTPTMDMLRLRDMHDYEHLPSGKWNIRQPTAADAAQRENCNATGGPDLIIVPGVAFEQCSGGGVARLGHGMGYYDRYFDSLFATCLARESRINGQRMPGGIDDKLATGETVLIGLAFGEQLVDGIPMDANDVMLDAVWTAE